MDEETSRLGAGERILHKALRFEAFCYRDKIGPALFNMPNRLQVLSSSIELSFVGCMP